MFRMCITLCLRTLTGTILRLKALLSNELESYELCFMLIFIFLKVGLLMFVLL